MIWLFSVEVMDSMLVSKFCCVYCHCLGMYLKRRRDGLHEIGMGSDGLFTGRQLFDSAKIWCTRNQQPVFVKFFLQYCVYQVNGCIHFLLGKYLIFVLDQI